MRVDVDIRKEVRADGRAASLASISVRMARDSQIERPFLNPAIQKSVAQPISYRGLITSPDGFNARTFYLRR